MRATLYCPLPPTLNEQIDLARNHWSASASAKKEWTNLAAILSASLPKFPGKVWLSFNWKIKNFGSDPDNIEASAKYIMDGLTPETKKKPGSGVIQKDSLMIIQTPVLHHFERGENSLELLISSTPIYELKLLPDADLAIPA